MLSVYKMLQAARLPPNDKGHRALSQSTDVLTNRRIKKKCFRYQKEAEKSCQSTTLFVVTKRPHFHRFVKPFMIGNGIHFPLSSVANLRVSISKLATLPYTINKDVLPHRP